MLEIARFLFSFIFFGTSVRKRERRAENFVRQWREHLGLTEGELAEKASIALRTLQGVEAGAPCRKDTKEKIVRALGFNPGSWQTIRWVFPEKDADFEAVRFV